MLSTPSIPDIPAVSVMYCVPFGVLGSILGFLSVLIVKRSLLIVPVWFRGCQTFFSTDVVHKEAESSDSSDAEQP